MKISNGPELNAGILSEAGNQRDFLEGGALWTFNYVQASYGPLLKKVQASYIDGIAEIHRTLSTPEETGVVALASRYINSKIPVNEDDLVEIANYQFRLQDYLGISDPNVTVQFYDDLINAVRPEHNKLIPILHVYHMQIHALKIAYERLKPTMNKANLTTRIIFGLVCIELMKMHVRLYLIEPVARTEQGKDLDWIYMLDMVFEDFSTDSSYNKEAFRTKNVTSINKALELRLQEGLKYIKEVRDHVAGLKELKKKGESDPKSDFPLFDGIIASIQRRFQDKGI